MNLPSSRFDLRTSILAIILFIIVKIISLQRNFSIIAKQLQDIFFTFLEFTIFKTFSGVPMNESSFVQQFLELLNNFLEWPVDRAIVRDHSNSTI
mmetsp:Transcript_43743/g.50307  ORF Transcript_43743/g.50307 Transcript_43743/m.50307 type:complete len:95 (+) Transcript_43743:177-461(+)